MNSGTREKGRAGRACFPPAALTGPLPPWATSARLLAHQGERLEPLTAGFQVLRPCPAEEFSLGVRSQPSVAGRECGVSFQARYTVQWQQCHRLLPLTFNIDSSTDFRQWPPTLATGTNTTVCSRPPALDTEFPGHLGGWKWGLSSLPPRLRRHKGGGSQLAGGTGSRRTRRMADVEHFPSILRAYVHCFW